MSKAVQHLSIINPQDEYQTPNSVFNQGIQRTGIAPVFDYCATRENRQCLDYFDKETNALKQKWVKDGWLNWPYSKTYEFLKHAYEQHLENNISLLCLGYNKSDTKWYWDFVEDKAEVYNIKGRIKFLRDGKPTGYSAPYPSIFIVYRKKP